jgi:hypothetical protein
MIKMKSIRSGNMGDGGVKIRRGREFAVSTETRASELEAHGLAYRIQTTTMIDPPVAASTVQNKAAEAGPLDSPGGETGAAGLALSSPPAPQRQGRRSRRLRGA